MRSIATRYNGRLYRSRLEARWGAFLDLLEWPCEYEPFDLHGWIPDFLLAGAVPVLVEVKPVYTFPWVIAAEIERSQAEHEVLIVGATLPVTPLGGAKPSGLILGWLAEQAIEPPHAPVHWDNAVFGRWQPGRIGFCHQSFSFQDRISGEHSGCHGGLNLTEYEIYQRWADAGNTTQWMRPR